MVDVAHGTSLTRPPTPPKENVEEAAKHPANHSYQGTLGQHVLLDSPNESPSSSSDYFAGSAAKLHKRVVFSPWTKYHNHVHTTDNATVLDAKVRPLPPSKECMALHKSILKASAEKNSPLLKNYQPLVLDPEQGLAVMLHSVTQRLTQASRDLRLDTYKALLGCLGAFDNVPETQILVRNLAGFLELIRRDIVAKQPGTAAFDIELVTSALKVLSTMACTQSLVDAMPDEFCTFVAEQAVSSLEHRDVPKIMMDHYMQLLGRQKFPQRVINTDRVNRLLTTLDGLEAGVKGNRVIGLKVMIYQRLLLQAKNLMLGRVGQWLEFLIACMSSSIKDIRSRAIAFGTDAALALGTAGAVSQACLDLLNGELPSGQKVIDCLGSRMLELLNDKDGAVQVPQIWSVIILFLRSRHHQVERWEHLPGWFGIMQHSFNSSDVKVKRQANIAWNRLVSAINLDTSTDLSMIRMLRQPIAAQLERKSSDKHFKVAKQVARSSYCNLLYFAFRPGSSQEQLDLYWDNFLIPVLSLRESSTKSDHDFACQVLAAILSSLHPRVWDQNRAHQASLLIKPEELPCLDPRWVRLRATKIIRMLERLLLHTNCPQVDNIQESPFFGAWRSFVKALGDAASKEVKVSMETMAAFAQITSMLNRYWHQNDGSTEASPPRLEVYIALINETLAKVGFRPFVEKRLLLDPSGFAFEAAETPSSRSGHSRRAPNTPIMYMLEFMVNSSPGIDTSTSYEEAIHALLTIALHAASGRRSRLAILQHLAIDVLSRPYAAITSRLVLWNCLAKETENALSMPPTKTAASDNPQYPGQDYRQLLILLEIGFQELGSGLDSSWKVLSDLVVEDIRKEVGEAGIVLAYTEPLARVIGEGIKSCTDMALRYGSYVVDQARWPVSRKEMERARKQLWGPGSSVSKDASLDPFDHLYSMVVALLTFAYSSLQPESLDAVVELISSVSSFLQMCPPSMRAVCLKRTQQGLAVWIEDPNTVMSRIDDTRASAHLYTAIKDLMETAMDVLKVVTKPDSYFLGMLEEFLIAGFRSRHRSMLNSMITTWNVSFAKADTLEYPVALRAVLTKLRPTVDIELPGLVDDDASEIISSPFNFVQSQEEENDATIGLPAAKATRLLTAPPSHGTNRLQKTAVRSPGTPSARASRRERRITPRARLRHDNSQIQFAAIDSSPLIPESGETQHLTDHQRETKERQERDTAAMFRDIRSSPRIARSAERPKELVLHRKQTSTKPLDVDAEPSPTFPPGDATMNEFLGSSPTPRSSSRGSVDRQFGEYPGSSPPKSPVPVFQGPSAKIDVPLKTAKSPEATLITVENMTQPPEASEAASFAPSVFGNPLEDETGYPSSLSVDKTLVVHDPTQRSQQKSPRTTNPPEPDCHAFNDVPEDPLAKKAIDVPEYKDPKDHIRSNADCHAFRATPEADMPRPYSDSKTKASVIGHSTGGTVESIEDSFCAQQPSSPSNDELVREQLFREIDEASSQAESQILERRPSMSSPSEASRKRKIRSNDERNPRKKARPEPPSCLQTVEVIVETRRNDQNSDEYTVIADWPAAGTKRPASSVIKEERSPLPARSLQPSPSRITVPNKALARRRTRSVADRTTLQPSDVVGCSVISTPNTHLETNTDHADMDSIEQRSRKRRHSAQFQDKSPEEPNKRRNQDKRTLYKDKDMSSSQIEGIKQILLDAGDARPEAHQTSSGPLSSSFSGGDTIPNTPCDEAPQPQEPNPAPLRGRSPGQRMLDRFKSLLNDLRHITLWPAEEKEMMKVALEVVGGVHEAGFRNGRHG
ncbi:MAG: hypothetical protein Q9171_002529 [Xanthocarpia ochracea]